ncbi:hypothetical protein HZS_751 [Henneguya salminicola]|nr:hypothetical protein HZS_751 [Henneguya salminicola]
MFKNLPMPIAHAQHIMEPIIKKKKLFYDGHSYTYSSKNKGTLYYKCSKYFSSACKCRPILCGQINVIKGAHICSAIQLELYPNQIYQSLLLKLKELYGSVSYPIPGKFAVYRNIREQRSSIFSNSIQAATLPPLRYLANSQPFLRRYWSWDIDGEYHQMLI